jgi:hypothetical protein
LVDYSFQIVGYYDNVMECLSPRRRHPIITRFGEAPSIRSPAAPPKHRIPPRGRRFDKRPGRVNFPHETSRDSVLFLPGARSSPGAFRR